MPKISVLLPIYNTKEEYLKECVNSILNQTAQDFELLILNDSPNNPYLDEVVASFKDKRIKYFKNEKNMGITASRNKLIDIAKGEYLAVMDHDDVCALDRFEKQGAYLDAHPEVGVVAGQTETFGGKHRISCNPIKDEDIRLGLMSRCVLWHPASMIRKSVLTKNNIYYEKQFSPAEDLGLWVRLIPYTRFHNLEDVVLKYRDHPNNTTKVQNDKRIAAMCRLTGIVKASYPALYEEFLLRATHVKHIYLLGFIPLFRIIQKQEWTKYYLFGCILLWSKEENVKLRR